MAKKQNTGNALSEELPKAKINKEALQKTKRLFTYIGKHKWKLYIGLFFLLLTGATALLFPMLLGKLVKTIEQKEFNEINKIGFLLILVLLFQSLFSFFRVYLFVNYTENTLASLRRAIYAHLITLPMSFFVQKRVGDLNSRMSADIAQIQDTLTTTLAEFLRQLILVVGGIILLVLISPKLTLLMLAILPVVAVAAVVFGRFIRKTSRLVQEKVAESNTIIEETLQGITNVKAFANEHYENNRYVKSTFEIIRVGLIGGKYRGSFSSFIIFCLFGAIVAVIWYGVYLASQNQLLIGDLISFILYSAFVGASFGGIAELYAQIQKAVGAIERVFEILDEKAEPIDISGQSNSLLRIEGNVIFDKVVFTYPSRKEIQVLKGVSFEARKGETVAIVGPSGAGKSTIVSLLLRFYDLENGNILIDGKDSTSYNLTALRNNMAIVPQDVILFGGTIKENIAYGKPNATDDEIFEAAKKANALNFIESFPEKFNTIVGDRGIKLSGGQRQRIAIARAVLKDPAILILDEATSSLDSESERLVQEALDKLMIGRTSIVIAHRLSTIRKANRIIVIDKGIAVENGTHDELMSIEGGLYHSLNRLQTQFQISE